MAGIHLLTELAVCQGESILGVLFILTTTKLPNKKKSLVQLASESEIVQMRPWVAPGTVTWFVSACASHAY